MFGLEGRVSIVGGRGEKRGRLTDVVTCVSGNDGCVTCTLGVDYGQAIRMWECAQDAGGSPEAPNARAATAIVKDRANMLGVVCGWSLFVGL